MSASNEKLKCLSVLLQFPDDEMIETLSGSKEQVAEAFGGADPPMEEFLDYLTGTPRIDLQEDYSATFDLNPMHCLNLTWHVHGDQKSRGAAMARFAKTYADAGYGPATGELPDFLPLVLEFLSVTENGAGRWIRSEYAATIDRFAGRLRDAGSPYAQVFEILSQIFKG